MIHLSTIGLYRPTYGIMYCAISGLLIFIVRNYEVIQHCKAKVSQWYM